MTLLTCVLALPVAVLVAPAAHACSCASPEPRTSIAEHDLIAEIRVRRAEVGDGQDVYGLEVHRSWKGTTNPWIEVSTASSESACGLQLREGVRYILFASGDEVQGWRTNLCSATFEVGAQDPSVTREEIEASLGEGTVVVQPHDEVTTGDRVLDADLMPWLVLGGVGLVLLVTIVGLVLRSRPDVD